LGVAWFFIQVNIGYLSQDYVIFILVLLGMVSATYDRYAIYRTSSTFSNKIFSLFNAWSISFLAIILLGFLTKQSQVYSRVFIVETYVIGFLLQTTAHFIVRQLSKSVNKHAQATDNAIIVGHGQLASYLEHKISSNPWLHQRVIGAVSIKEEMPKAARSVQRTSTNEYSSVRTIELGQVSELPALIDEHNINTIYIVTPLESSKVLEELYFVLLDKHVSIHWVPDIFSLRQVSLY